MSGKPGDQIERFVNWMEMTSSASTILESQHFEVNKHREGELYSESRNSLHPFLTALAKVTTVPLLTSVLVVTSSHLIAVY